MSGRLVWTPEMDAAPIALRAKGLSQLVCSERIGASHQMVARRIRDLGLPAGLAGRRGRTKEKRAGVAA